MSNITLLEAVKQQLILRTSAGALQTSELIQILEIESRPVTVTQTTEKTVAAPVVAEPIQPPVPFTPEPQASESPSEEPHVEDEPEMTPVQKEKKEISQKIADLGGTPPEKGSLQKFKDALKALETKLAESQEEEDEPKTKEKPVESDDDEDTDEDDDEDEAVDAFNHVISQIQELYKELLDEDIVEDQEFLFDIMAKINHNAESPDELSLDEIRQVYKEVQKLK